MSRPISPTLEALLPLCETQSTVEILLRGDEDAYLLATAPLDIAAKGEYEKGLLKVGEFKETFGQATNRININLSNADQEWGLRLADETRKLEFADVKVGRFYRDGKDLDINEHVHFFIGKAVGANSGELALSFDVITPETAAGTCLATETLTPANDWVFEYVSPSPPGSGGNDGGEGNGSCPRTDQLVLSQDENGNLQAITAAEVKTGSMLWNPLTKSLQKVRSVEIVENQPIWEAVTKNGASGFCSPTHPFIRSASDGKGTAVQCLKEKQKTLTCSFGEVKQSQLITVRNTGTTASVVRIEMEKEHVYAFGVDTDFMFVCHNAQNKNSEILV